MMEGSGRCWILAGQSLHGDRGKEGPMAWALIAVSGEGDMEPGAAKW
ncbi:hypothetical protein AH4AK4_2782 [Aeromonas hydrophila 4AK4]|nr:hypothetical protein AH4AK4_2782 [Aeromonas hydrophila 4AK4]